MKDDGFCFDLSLILHLLIEEEKRLLGQMILEGKDDRST